MRLDTLMVSSLFLFLIRSPRTSYDDRVRVMLSSGAVDDGYYYVAHSYGREDRRARMMPTTLGGSTRLVTSTTTAASTVSSIPTGTYYFANISYK